MPDVNSFLNPTSVVVVGVSRDKNKIGRLIFDQLLSPQRKVYGVNPRIIRLDKQKIYSNLTEIPNGVQLAIYAIPAELVVESVKEAVSLGINNHLIISSGFGESDQNGKLREKELEVLVKKYQISLQGPNCLGNISSVYNFNASFGYKAPKGNIGFISQSGAMGTAFLDWIAKRSLGISHFISLGNKINLNENDFLEFLGQDDNTKVIALYLESISDGCKFLDLAKKIALVKPVVIIKGGQTKEAKIAITSHTGVLAGSFAAQRAAFRQANLIEAESTEEFFSLIEICSTYYSQLEIKDIIVISNAGGPGVLLVDKYSENKVQLTTLSQDVKNNLKSVLPSSSSLNNPIDILGDANEDRLEKVLNTLKNAYPHAFLQVVFTPQENTDLQEMADVIIKFSQDFKGKLIVSMIGGNKPLIPVQLLESKNIITIDFPENIPLYLKKLIAYNSRKKQISAKIMPKVSISPEIKNKLLKEVFLNQESGFLTDEKALILAKAYKFPFVNSAIVKNEKELMSYAVKFNYPLALKVSSTLIMHRNAVNGVKLNLQNKRELIAAYNVLHPLSEQLLLQKMIEHETEVIVGVKKDADFSHLLLFGSGGIHADYLSDVNFGVIPLTYEDMEEMINGTKIAKLVKDKRLFWPVFSSLTSMLTDWPQIQEVDINPVVVLKDKLFCVDFKIKI